MNMAWAVAIAVLLRQGALGSPGVLAQPSGGWTDSQPIRRVFQNLAVDTIHLPSVANGIILLTGGGATAGLHAADDRVASAVERAGPAPAYTALGRVLGDGTVQAGAAVATYGVGALAHKPEMTQVGGDLVRGQVLNGVLTTAIKYSFDRTRPSGGQHTFPSGHVSATATSAAVLFEHFGWRVGAPAFAVAGFVGWTRIRDNQHWLSDVAGGATLGLVVGRTVTAGHRKHAWTIAPAAARGSMAIYIVHQ